MTTTATKNLITARQLIEKPEAWGQGQSTLRERKNTLCAAEALYTASDWQQHHYFPPGYGLLENAMGTNITSFNDTHSHADVLAAFDRAIAAAAETTAKIPR